VLASPAEWVVDDVHRDSTNLWIGFALREHQMVSLASLHKRLIPVATARDYADRRATTWVKFFYLT
jgi:hypothetical protein